VRHVDKCGFAFGVLGLLRKPKANYRMLSKRVVLAIARHSDPPIPSCDAPFGRNDALRHSFPPQQKFVPRCKRDQLGMEKRVTPRLDSERHKDKLFQRLTANKGYPKLREHLGAVVTMMQLSDSWHDFMAKLDRLRPRLDLKSLKKGAQQLSFDYDSNKDTGIGL
jgi:hypothetical protein